MSIKLCSLVLILCVTVIEINCETITVETSLGVLRGLLLNSVSGKSYYSFRGIRYAKSTADHRRFEPPIPIEPWTGELDATSDGPICPQPTATTYGTLPSEDCLFLNVYTRNLSPTINSSVLVFIHGGANFAGTAASWIYGADYIMDQENIVLVMINYRLGPFGFLGTGTSECPGNMGYKDQVLALRWVKDYIHNFGGNRNSVTLMGQSAGATSVNLFLVSPMARNLFHGVILMSGSAMEKLPYENHQLSNLYKLVHHFDCPKTDISTMLSCLRQISADRLANTLELMHNFHIFPMQSWYAVVENDFGQERFLVEDPIISIREGRFSRVPILTGVTSYEFASLAVRILANDELRRDIETNFDTYAPFIFSYENGTHRTSNITQSVRQMLQITDYEFNGRKVEKLGNVISDGNVNFGVHRLVKMASKWTTVFYYKNSFVGNYSHFPYLADVGSLSGNKEHMEINKKYFGCAHGDDLLHLLYMPKISGKFDDYGSEFAHRLMKFWTNFVHYGNPNNPIGNNLSSIEYWTPYNISKQNYFDIGNELKMCQGLYTDRLSKWDELFCC